MKNKKKILTVALALTCVVGLSACNKKNDKNVDKNETKIEQKEEKITKQSAKKKAVKTFKLNLEDFDKDAATPFIVKIVHKDKEYYEPAIVKSVEKDNTTYVFEVPVVSEDDEISLFVPGVNVDNTYATYEITEETLDSDKAITLTPIKKTDVNSDVMEKVINGTKIAFELDCSTLDDDAKNIVIENQYKGLMTEEETIKEKPEEKAKETNDEEEISEDDVYEESEEDTAEPEVSGQD